ncbi:protein kinase [Haloferula sp. BvORR071]|uniref:protein kinase domain-containing protein n=1 Tax=Haloferula sp. BvORR071 TaxID=1396141 RepID=UPI00069688C0|nr:protein kinase [Haloferula sp. BvORR071]
MSADFFEAPEVDVLGGMLPAYEVQLLIAKGGMGAVYKACQRSLDRDVAIKILPREFGADPQFLASFETEAKAMARLNHPNLIAVYDYGEVAGMPYIVMEYVNGKSLYHSAVNLKVEPAQAVGIVKGICDGLAHAHENGVIHRDIKPANILLTPRAVPKIGDFGLARPLDTDGEGLAMGTPGYVAREVIHHPEKADRRSDLFALGVVLYELLVGKHPPYDSTPPASTLCSCDPALDRICEKAMNPLAELRYQTAEEMSAALDGWLRHHASGAQAAASPAARAFGGPRPIVPPTAGFSRESRRRASSSAAVKGMVMLAAAIVVAAVGWTKFSDSQRAKEDALRKAQTQTPPPQQVAEKTPEAPVSQDTPPEKSAPERVPAPRGERTLESLARLKSALVAGDRAEMPAGSVKLGDGYFMVMPQPMSWGAASAFAAEYGAHLFVAKTATDLEKLTLLMPAGVDGAETGVWLGAGSAGVKYQWSWVDGSPWQAEMKPEGAGSYVILDGKGELRAREANDRYPFAMQWREDGKNPAALAEMLARTGDAINAGTPLYPPGTLEHEGSRIFIATAPMSYGQAAELAASAGGKLMAPATKELDEWLAKKLPADDSGSDGFWLGGTRAEGAWAWATGEPWEYTRWIDDSASEGPGDKLKLIPGQAWAGDAADTTAAGFIIEWPAAGKALASGAAHAQEETPKAPEVELPPALLELEAKAKQLLEDLAKERDKGLAANVKNLNWELDNWLSNLSKNEVNAWRRDVNLLKQAVRKNRIPQKLGNGFRMSQPMSKIATYCTEKQAAIDADFDSKAIKIRDSYVTRMMAARDGAAPDLAAAIQRRIEIANKMEPWLEGFGVQGTKQLQAGGFRIISATYATWDKSADVTERVRELLVEEHRAFHVGPGELKKDPNPGWNKRLTVTYEMNGVRGSKHWGENAKVGPEDFLPAE